MWQAPRRRVALLAGVVVAGLVAGSLGLGMVAGPIGPIGVASRAGQARAGGLAAIDTSAPQYGMHAMIVGQGTTLFDQAQASGATWVRLSVSWRNINPAAGSFTYA